MDRANEVLDFWFGSPDSVEYGTERDFWFSGGAEIDAQIRDRFLALYEEAAAGTLDHWRQVRHGCLALILLLDQFPRNMFRGEARAFATDAKALACARHAITQGFDRDRPAGHLQFFYLPFEHSEDIGDQRRSEQLMRSLPEYEEKSLHIRYAVLHREVIERFGRFPTRNADLGRKNTPEEDAFLMETGGQWSVDEGE
jgi:uncharacterized protein (DUF924 family)